MKGYVNVMINYEVDIARIQLCCTNSILEVYDI